MAHEQLLAGVEIGGTKTILLLARGQEIVQSHSMPTEAPAVTLENASALLREWQDETSFAALGIASFGPLDVDRASARYGHMLPTPKPGWTDANIVGALSQGLNCPVAIDTDVNGAAMAEAQWGAGAEGAGGCNSLCYITIGTGVGGGFVINGQPVHGAMHPEIGHIRIPRSASDSFAGVCPFHGDCIEGLISGPALAARFGVPGQEIADEDPRWSLVVEDIAQLVSSILLMTSVRKVLIGGGVGMARATLLGQVCDRVVALLGGYLPFVTEKTVSDIIRTPALGDKAGPLGAIAVAGLAFRNVTAG